MILLQPGDPLGSPTSRRTSAAPVEAWDVILSDMRSGLDLQLRLRIPPQDTEMEKLSAPNEVALCGLPIGEPETVYDAPPQRVTAAGAQGFPAVRLPLHAFRKRHPGKGPDLLRTAQL